MLRNDYARRCLCGSPQDKFFIQMTSRLLNYKSLLPQMIRREISERYKGSVLGVFWSLITPLVLLGVYTFVFSGLFNSRWSGSDSTADFAVILFAGLLMYQYFADVLVQAPSLILSHANFVKKVVFPLEILVPVVTGSALFHAFISFLILLAAVFYVKGSIPLTVLWTPVIVLPFTLMILGFGWALAAFGVYLRDIGQIMGTVTTALLFLAPIFYPPTAIPDWIAPYVNLNPIAIPIEMLRGAAIFGQAPDPFLYGAYSLVALSVAIAGYLCFQMTRRGFADVI